MSKWFAATALALGSISSQAIAQGKPPTIRNYTTPGNLESNYNLGCIDVKDAKPIYNPVDLFKASKACITAHRYDEALRLYALGGAYGRYDMRRVADSTAHQAVTVARMEIFGDVSDTDAQKFKASTALDNPAAKAAFCADVSRIGPPNYFPRYMIQHGMGAFFGAAKDGLVANFDAKSAWNEALSAYLHCTSS